MLLPVFVETISQNLEKLQNAKRLNVYIYYKWVTKQAKEAGN